MDNLCFIVNISEYKRPTSGSGPSFRHLDTVILLVQDGLTDVFLNLQYMVIVTNIQARSD